LVGLLAGAELGGKFVPNYDESKVPAYRLPDPLAPPGGPAVTDRASWESAGRPRTLELFESHVYGRVPADFQPALEWKLDREDGSALDGSAIRREYLITIGGIVPVRMLLYLPKDAPGPVPCFLGLNFRGNQRVEVDPAITMETGFVIDGSGEVEKNRPTEASRGTGAERWPAKLIVGRGYALATACCGNFDPDFDDGFHNGVHALDSAPRSEQSWGTISAWAWGLSRLLDVLQKIEEVDGDRVAVIGHSRLAKTALWAGARDQRFAMVISNNSGCGGAALSRRAFGETVDRINTNFPHWFAGAFKRYNRNESALPIDQHQLIGLIAPRPVYVASATADQWADPKGEFLSLKHAEAVYQLYQKNPFGAAEAPPPGRHVGHLMGYHLREGPHAITAEDWRHYLDFADQWLEKKPESPVPGDLPLGVCLVHEMGYIPELESWKSAGMDKAGAHTIHVTKAWKELAPSLEPIITAKLAQRLSRWAAEPMETYTQVPPIGEIGWEPVRTDAGGRRILFEGTLDTLPTHSPIVTRWLRVYVLYDSARETILRTTVTIRGEAHE
jgi:hypothetical protein